MLKHVIVLFITINGFLNSNTKLLLILIQYIDMVTCFDQLRPPSDQTDYKSVNIF